KVLVGDIGGSNARFAVADPDSLRLEHFRALPSRQFASLQEAVRRYLYETGIRVTTASFAIAAPLAEETIRMTNLPWSFTREELREACGFSRLELSNDFAALARAVPHLEPQDLHRIGGGDPDPEGTKIVLGPGTGLGLAGIVKTDLGWL